MDIVERLRKCANGFPLFKTNQGDYGVCDEAADEIERLRDELQKIVFVTSSLMFEAADEIKRLRKALQSIAKNTCCDTCQEAALVARKALGEKE